MTLQIGNALGLLRGHGGDNRENKSKWGNLTLTPAKLKLIATFIEQRGVKDGLELVGHHGKLLSIHPTLLCLITGSCTSIVRVIPVARKRGIMPPFHHRVRGQR